MKVFDFWYLYRMLNLVDILEMEFKTGLIYIFINSFYLNSI